MIKTKVARIINPTTFLAAGTLQGVKEGMEFIIYELTDPIFDPESNEPLGELELHKGRVRVTNVQEKLSQALTLPRKRYLSGLRELFDVRLAGGRWVEEHEPLPVEEGTAVATQTELKVRVGDLVRSVD